jgi:hypothetical protein
VYYNFCFYYILLWLNVLQSDIDNLVNGFSSVLLDAAKDTFGFYKRMK